MAILKSQQKRRLGIISDVQMAIEERRPLSSMEKYIGVKGDPKRKYKMVAVFGGGTLFIMFYLFWWLDIGSYVKPYIPFTGAKIGYHCEKCGAAFIARETTYIPIKCPECGQKEALYGFHCRNSNKKCNLIFGVSDRSVIPKCPRCNIAAFVEPLTPIIIEEAKTGKKKKAVPEGEGGE